MYAGWVTFPDVEVSHFALSIMAADSILEIKTTDKHNSQDSRRAEVFEP